MIHPILTKYAYVSYVHHSLSMALQAQIYSLFLPLAVDGRCHHLEADNSTTLERVRLMVFHHEAQVLEDVTYAVVSSVAHREPMTRQSAQTKSSRTRTARRLESATHYTVGETKVTIILDAFCTDI